jgi:hypothetical protein
MIGNITAQTMGVPTEKRDIGHGEAAMLKTMSIMWELINKASEDYYVRRWAEKMTEGAGRQDLQKLMALYTYLSQSMEYCKDIDGTEMLKTPKLILQLIEMGEVPQLDCDCMTMLILALAKSIGLRGAMRAVALPPNEEFSHIYAIVRVVENGAEQWIPVDLTRPDKGFGWEHPGAIKVKTMMKV